MTLGHTDEQILRESIRREHAEPRVNPRIPVVRINPKAKAATAPRNLAKFELASFVLRRNKPDQFEDSEDTLQAYAACPMAVGSDALLIPCSNEASGGYWMAVPCMDSEPAEGECPHFDSGVYPLPELSIENLADNSTTPQFDGWFEKVNGRHQLQQLTHSRLFPQTALHCTPSLTIAVENNQGNSDWPSGPLTILWFTDQTELTLFFHAGYKINTFIGAVPITAILPENGANPYPRNSNGKLIAKSKYSDWRGSAAGGTGRSNYADLLTWLSAGTFTLYPS